jgi:hypothetical protein
VSFLADSQSQNIDNMHRRKRSSTQESSVHPDRLRLMEEESFDPVGAGREEEDKRMMAVKNAQTDRLTPLSEDEWSHPNRNSHEADRYCGRKRARSSNRDGGRCHGPSILSPSTKAADKSRDNEKSASNLGGKRDSSCRNSGSSNRSYGSR